MPCCDEGASAATLGAKYKRSPPASIARTQCGTPAGITTRSPADMWCSSPPEMPLPRNSPGTYSCGAMRDPPVTSTPPPLRTQYTCVHDECTSALPGAVRRTTSVEYAVVSSNVDAIRPSLLLPRTADWIWLAETKVALEGPTLGRDDAF